jgi:hypothetical protein
MSSDPCRSIAMRIALASLLLAVAGGCSTPPETAASASDAPEPRSLRSVEYKDAPSYAHALQLWQTPEDVNAWIGAKFQYDVARAMALSESQRGRSGSLPIHSPPDFFADPSGVCVDLSRFAVETLQQIDPALKTSYLMIEFSPVNLGGNTLRLHWLAFFEREGKYYFLADSKRPGHMAGPYAGVPEFLAEYARYRGREVVAFRELESYRRKLRTTASRESREERRP